MRKHYFVRFLRRLRILKHMLIYIHIELNRSKYTIPVLEGLNEGLLYSKPTFKSDLIRILLKHIRIDQFVDVGANYGQTLLEVISLLPEIEYHAFEPNPTTYDLLDRLIIQNNISAALYPCALSDENLPKKLYMTNDRVNSGATITPDIRPDTYINNNGTWISTYSLDSIRNMINFKKNFLFKIDVEGSEFKVLKGAENVIQVFRPIIMCEVLHAHSEEMMQFSEAHKEKIYKYLSELNYKIYLCNLGKLSHSLLNITRIDSFPVSIYKYSPDTCDYLFMPGELDFSIA